MLEPYVKAFRAAIAANDALVPPFQKLIGASKDATEIERNAAILALLDPHGLDLGHAEIFGLMCVASGALVEDGASTLLGLDTILDRMADGAEILAEADLDDVNLDAQTPPPQSLPFVQRTWVAGFKEVVRGAMARLARDHVARKQLRDHVRLEAALRALAEKKYANHVHYVTEILDMLDDEPLHVVDLCAGSITRYRAFGIRNGFHLMTILDGQNPADVIASGADFVQAKYGYYTWPALEQKADGTFVAQHLGSLLWGEPPAATLPMFEGVRTIIRAHPAFARSWDTHFIAPLHEALNERLVAEHVVPPEEARPILLRIAARRN
jgi:hypothetical protein